MRMWTRLILQLSTEILALSSYVPGKSVASGNFAQVGNYYACCELQAYTWI